MRDAQKALHCTGELIMQDAINQVEIVNTVAEGIQQAMKNPPTIILYEHHQETTNLAEENMNMQKKLDDMHNLVKQIQDQMAQQQMPTYIHQGYQQLYNQQLYYHQHQHQSFTDRTNTYNSYHLSMAAAETSTKTTPTTIIVKVGTIESSIAEFMDAATIQVQIVSQKCKVIKMRQRFKTEWEEVQGDANDG
eukprot:15176501-Ditylum_brightwellii.AAC.1